MHLPVALQGTPMFFWVWQTMWLLFACYCFGLAIYRKIRVQQEVTEGQTTERKP
jgi:hypothetical protein